jgi:hypothetical protein
MPHFGLMDEDKLGPEKGPLMRAKLHIRCGVRRLKEEKTSEGILTLYDALTSGMKWYLASPDRRKGLDIRPGDDLTDDATMFDVLARSGVVKGFDYESFDRLVAEALEKKITGFDYEDLLAGFQSAMTQIGVMPFDEGELPPEDPSTF